MVYCARSEPGAAATACNTLRLWRHRAAGLGTADRPRSARDAAVPWEGVTTDSRLATRPTHRMFEPESAPRHFELSDFGDLLATESVDPVNGVTRRVEYQYDGLGRMVHSIEVDNGVDDKDTERQFTYDTAAHVTSMFQPANVLGRLAWAWTPTLETAFGYDALGRVNGRAFSDGGEVYIEESTYRGDGNVATLQMRLPDNGHSEETVSYG